MSTEAYPNGLTFEGAIRVLFAADQSALDAFAAMSDQRARSLQRNLAEKFHRGTKDWAPYLWLLNSLRADIRRDLLDATRRRSVR